MSDAGANGEAAEAVEFETSFGGLTVREVEKFNKRNLVPFREVFDHLRKGVLGEIVVPTGEIITEGPNKGRGKTELDRERGFRDVAAERGVGLRVQRTQLTTGNTRLGLYVTDKREFTPEAQKKRDDKLDAHRAAKAGVTVEEYRKVRAAKKAAAAKAAPTTAKPPAK